MDNAQKYLDTLLEEAKKRITSVDNLVDTKSELFKKLEKEDDIDYVELYKVSSEIQDAKVYFSKIASYLYFLEQLDIHVDTGAIKDVKGLPDFIVNYIPFEVVTTVDDEGVVKLIKADIDDELLSAFQVQMENFKKS